MAFVDALREVDGGIDAELVDEAFYREILALGHEILSRDETREGSSTTTSTRPIILGSIVFENVLVGEVEVSAGNVFTTTVSKRGILESAGDTVNDLLVQAFTGGVHGRQVDARCGEAVLVNPEAASLTYYGGMMMVISGSRRPICSSSPLSRKVDLDLRCQPVPRIAPKVKPIA